MQPIHFLLASSSPYRANLLKQLGMRFERCSPAVDERPVDDESPAALAKRLSEAKAEAVALKFPKHVIIASDQVACIEGSNVALGKPHHFANAVAQLSQCSGKTVHFFTGLCLIFPNELAHSVGKERKVSLVEAYDVVFRQLSQAQIEAYLKKEEPYHCAGSFKAEGLGITLFERFSGRDYNTLIGLPLMALVDCLNDYGIDLIAQP